MNNDEFGAREHVDELAAGQCAIVSALVITLDESGALPRQRFCDVLQRLWVEMPEEPALGAGGEIIERVLELVGSSVPVNDWPGLEEKQHALAASSATPANDDAVPCSGPRSLKSIIEIVRGFGQA